MRRALLAVGAVLAFGLLGCGSIRWTEEGSLQIRWDRPTATVGPQELRGVAAVGLGLSRTAAPSRSTPSEGTGTLEGLLRRYAAHRTEGAALSSGGQDPTERSGSSCANGVCTIF
ncbi:MAG: hypothetical protein KatS3mg115_0816 [Candidatus Poribacteria bacterium]|nr:MAG: hypothetical protein KatS3mg115_0816 [Candidatus Poribacteria bacterium]